MAWAGQGTCYAVRSEPPPPPWLLAPSAGNVEAYEGPTIRTAEGDTEAQRETNTSNSYSLASAKPTQELC